MVLVQIVHHPHLATEIVPAGDGKTRESKGGERVLQIRFFPADMTEIVREAADELLSDPDIQI